ncbi:MAG: hypothetical protein GX422_08365 [Deltaproteobacteria bacterium]|nr:hypothetical protein [Deltaproteobacteria bacterium]
MKVTVLLLVPLALVLLGSPVLSDSYGPYFQCYPPERDTFGDAFRMARDGQILDPDAGLNLEPVEGLEGRAAEGIHEKYIESLGKKAGGGGGGGTVGFVPLITGGAMGQ